FFQAEDGIRDRNVTGVQTCALPILRALGGEVEERPDGLTVYGSRLHGGRVGSAGDHRIAMAFAVAGLLAGGPVTVEGAESIKVSFPEFGRVLQEVTGQKISRDL